MTSRGRKWVWIALFAAPLLLYAITTMAFAAVESHRWSEHAAEATRWVERGRRLAGPEREAPAGLPPFAQACASVQPVEAEQVLIYRGGADRRTTAALGFHARFGGEGIEGVNRSGELFRAYHEWRSDFFDDWIDDYLLNTPDGWFRHVDLPVQHDLAYARARYLVTLMIRDAPLPRVIDEQTYDPGPGARVEVAVYEAARDRQLCHGELHIEAPATVEYTTTGSGRTSDDAQRDAVRRAAADVGYRLDDAYAQQVDRESLRAVCTLGGPRLCQLAVR